MLVLDPTTVLKNHGLVNGNNVIPISANRIFVCRLLFAKHDVSADFAGYRAVPLSEFDLMTYGQSFHRSFVQGGFTIITRKHRVSHADVLYRFH